VTVESLAQPILQFYSGRLSVWETGRVAVVKVVQTADSSGKVSVNFATSDGTAIAGQDYTATSGTPVFEPGETEKSFTVPILDNERAGAK
jgi:hypothetical protein